MYVCRVFIAPEGVDKIHEDVLEQNLRSLADQFTEYSPRMDVLNHFVQFEDIDRHTATEIEAFVREKGYNCDPKVDLIIEERPTDQELHNARYVPLCVAGDYVDEDETGEPLNRYQEIVCEECFLPKEDAVPNPYFVSRDKMQNFQDIYLA